MYYLDEAGKRVYTLKVRRARRARGPAASLRVASHTTPRRGRLHRRDSGRALLRRLLDRQERVHCCLGPPARARTGGGCSRGEGRLLRRRQRSSRAVRGAILRAAVRRAARGRPRLCLAPPARSPSRSAPTPPTPPPTTAEGVAVGRGHLLRAPRALLARRQVLQAARRAQEAVRHPPAARGRARAPGARAPRVALTRAFVSRDGAVCPRGTCWAGAPRSSRGSRG